MSRKNQCKIETRCTHRTAITSTRVVSHRLVSPSSTVIGTHGHGIWPPQAGFGIIVIHLSGPYVKPAVRIVYSVSCISGSRIIFTIFINRFFRSDFFTVARHWKSWKINDCQRWSCYVFVRHLIDPNNFSSQKYTSSLALNSTVALATFLFLFWIEKYFSKGLTEAANEFRARSI